MVVKPVEELISKEYTCKLIALGYFKILLTLEFDFSEKPKDLSKSFVSSGKS